MNGRIRLDAEIRDAVLEAGAADAYKCYQCGKCMAVCPWCHVERVPFPVYRVPQSVRLGAVMASEDPDVIEQEVAEIYRCVGCLSCSTWCPHGVSLPDIMRAIRRLLVEFGSYPAQLKEAVGRVASSGNPFGEARGARAAWAEAAGVPLYEAGMELASFTCCVAAYDPRGQEVARAGAEVLSRAGLSFGVLSEATSCCSESVRRVGAEEVFQEVAGANLVAFAEAGVQTLVVGSPHCYLAFTGDYPELGGEVTVRHQTQLFWELIQQERITPRRELAARVVYHDPCTLGRGSGVYDEPRRVLESIPGLELVEIPGFARDRSLCCGGGSGGVWLERAKGERLSDIRVQQAASTGAAILAVACPYCLQMFTDSVRTMGLDLEVKDVSELLVASL